MLWEKMKNWNEILIYAENLSCWHRSHDVLDLISHFRFFRPLCCSKSPLRCHQRHDRCPNWLNLPIGATMRWLRVAMGIPETTIRSPGMTIRSLLASVRQFWATWDNYTTTLDNCEATCWIIWGNYVICVAHWGIMIKNWVILVTTWYIWVAKKAILSQLGVQ